MSQRERDRLQVLQEVKKGHLTQKQAGAQLKLSDRWIRKLVARLRKEGEAGYCTDYAGGPRSES